MTSTVLILLSLLGDAGEVVDHNDALLTGGALAVGWGGSVASTSCLLAGVDCSTAHVGGIAASASALAMYGGLAKIGVRADGTLVPKKDRMASAAALLLMLHLGRDLFADLGLGVAYAWAREPNHYSAGSHSSDSVGFAASLQVGAYVSRHFAAVARADLTPEVPGFIDFLGGVQWTL